MMRKILDALYRTSGLAGGFMLLAMLAMVTVQMMARWVEVPVTGLTEIAGYCMAATSFFGLGYAFSTNAHIRVNLIVGQAESATGLSEILCTFVAAVIAAALAYFAVRTTVHSYLFGEISQGQDAMPVWMPQTVMSIGTIILLIALLDRWVGLLFQNIGDTPGNESLSEERL